MSLSALEGPSGATPRGQPWTSAVTLPHRRNGLNARRMAVLYTFGKPVLRRHVHCALMRSALLDMPPIMPTTACHQRNYVERYSRYSTGDRENGGGSPEVWRRAVWRDGIGRTVAAVWCAGVVRRRIRHGYGVLSPCSCPWQESALVVSMPCATPTTTSLLSLRLSRRGLVGEGAIQFG